MGRRALPKIDPKVEFDSYLFQLDELESPLNIDRIFDSSSLAGSAPLEIEVGSGKGLFLTNSARANPDCRYLGVEVSRKYARYAAYRFARNQCRNAKMIRGDGLKLFSDFLQPSLATAVHVYFPDPWWKERHRERRVMQPSFVGQISRVLKRQGVFHFWTDVEEYFESTIEMIGQADLFGAPVIVGESPATHDMDYRTHFERRMRIHGHPVFRCYFVVND